MLEFKDVSHVFTEKSGRESRQVTALENINLSIRGGEFVCLLGPSGCGKSTILNLAAGFILPTEGVIQFNGHTIIGAKRSRSVVFQESGLIPWLSVEENIRLAVSGTGEQKARLSAEVLETVGLRGFDAAMPHELSGGMKQKVSIARCLAMKSKLMLMDEPFASLDEQTRLRLNREMIDIWRQEKKTILFITHSIQEAVVLGTRVVLMSKRPGRIKREWILGDEGLSGEDRQRMRLENPDFVVLTSRIRESMELCCPPGHAC